MMTSRSGIQDRRGFDFLMKWSLVGVVISFLLLILYNWKTGLCLVITFCIVFITLEAISRPPENNPEVFKLWAKRYSGKRYPTLLCLGDSLTHGAMSANYTPEVPIQLASVLGLEIPPYGRTFNDPIWVVNAAQNGLTSYTLLHERLSRAMNVFPDYIVLMIGTNDVSISLNINEFLLRSINDTLPIGEPNLQALGRNIRSIIQFIREASPKVELGVCTLPPLGEDLNSTYNRRIQEANAIIEKIVLEEEKNERTTLIPVYAGLEGILEKRKRNGFISPKYGAFVGFWMYPFYYMLAILRIKWNTLSSFVGNVILTDGIHLNETASDVIATLIVDWLKSRNVAKAIAIKSM